MKFKKVLSLGAVLGAVLSVGMVVSASAATKPEGLTFPEQGVAMREYPLNVNTMPPNNGAAGTYVKADDEELNGRLSYIGIKSEEAHLVKLVPGAAIGFHIDSACNVIIITQTAGSGQTAENAFLYKEDGTAVKENITPGSNAVVTLTDPGNYFIAIEAQQNNALIEEIEFTAQDSVPTAELISRKAKAGTTSNSGNIALFKDGSKYYAVVLFEGGRTDSAPDKPWANFSISPKNSDGSGGVTDATVVYKDLTIDGKVNYDANFFGEGDFLYAVELDNTDGSIASNEGTPENILNAISFSHSS